MFAKQSAGSVSNSVNDVTAADIEEILAASGWLAPARTGSGVALQEWLVRSAELLGPYAKERSELGPLLRPIFEYDAAAILRDPGNQAALAREGAREVIRALANELLEGGAIDSGRFKEIVENMKSRVPYRSRDLFHPVRLVLTGRTGEGELDRIILLLDAASKLSFAVRVKSAHERVLEFCGAFD
jgi:glutamyl-tRNA synthetase/nondiscriminating glutamyl-tRNA synthetase